MTVYPINLISDAHADRSEVIVFYDDVPMLIGRPTFYLGRYAVEGYDVYDEDTGAISEGLMFAYR